MRFRSKEIIAGIMHHSCLCGLLRFARRSSLIILCYHRVLPAKQREKYFYPDLVVTPEIFRQQVAFCVKHYNCLNLKKASQTWHTNNLGEKPLLVFTFDDGYADNFQYAAPILNEFGASGTFFIISSLNDTLSIPWYDRLARAVQMLFSDLSRCCDKLSVTNEDDLWLAKHLDPQGPLSAACVVGAAKILGAKRRLAVVNRACELADMQEASHGHPDKMMTREEIRTLIGQGHEIGAHTRTHSILTQLEDEELVSELEGGRSDLSDATGREVTSLAYPNGDFDQRVIEATRMAGYCHAVTTVSGLNQRITDPLALRRIYVSQDRLTDVNGEFSRNLFQLELSGAADALYLRNLRRGAKA